MGVARLLAKGWILVCLYAGAHAVRLALQSGADLFAVLPALAVCLLLFMAMGLVFAGGFGASAGHTPLVKRMTRRDFIPGFNETVFAGFVVLSYLDQVLFAPAHLGGPVIDALEAAVYFVVPGQRALADTLASCSLDGGRIFASASTWFLAFVFLGSALSHLKLSAGIIRLERAARPTALGPAMRAFALGFASIVGVQMLFVGTAYGFLPCSAFAGLPGALIIGLAPLMLSYLIFAALASLLANGH